MGESRTIPENKGAASVGTLNEHVVDSRDAEPCWLQERRGS